MSRTKGKAHRNGLPKGKRALEADESTSEPPAKRIATGTGSQPEKRPEQTDFDPSVAPLLPDQLADKFATAIKKHRPHLSTIELEDESLPSKAFKDTSQFKDDRLDRNLPQYLETNAEGGREELSRCDSVASPHTLIIALSAIRVGDLIRAVRTFGTEENKIAKLWAKHMKLHKMVDYVQQTRFGIGAGTPKRIEDLVQQEALKLDKLKRIVVDASFINEKKNTIFDDHDGFLQTISLLNLENIKLRFFSGETEILVF